MILLHDNKGCTYFRLIGTFQINLIFPFQFIQVSNESEPQNIFELMTKIWKVDKPQILISVTGGAKSCNLNPKLKDMFVNGLRKVLAFLLCAAEGGNFLNIS